MITYRKTKNGDWVVFGPAAEVVVGTVTVTKKNGETKKEQVEKVGKQFDVDGVPHCYGYTVRKQHRQEGGTSKCAECGGYGATVEAPDSSGIIAKICRRCASTTTRHERSYA